MEQKTIKELVKEMSTRTVTPKELDAAREYEKSLIPEDLSTPITGEIYRTCREIDVTTVIQFSAPFTSGYQRTLPTDTEITIGDINQERPHTIMCLPVKSDEIDRILISKEDRDNEMYTGYHLSINIKEFVDGFELIKDESRQ